MQYFTHSNILFYIFSFPNIPYFFSYKMTFYSFQNSPKTFNPSSKTDLDLWDCLGKVKLVFYQNFIGLIALFVVILERGRPHLIAE